MRAAVEDRRLAAVVCRNVAVPRFIIALPLVASTLVVGSDARSEPSAGAPSASATAANAPDDTTSGPSRPGVVFPYRQRRLLYSRNAPGGFAYVSPGATRHAALPVVVFLHGMNPDGLMHPWFGPAKGDLRPVIDSLVASGKVAPLVVAAPTHTRYATGATVMWPHFDLGDFLDATEAALGEAAKLDRSRVIVVGHSAAGCNAKEGIFAESIRRARPLALVDIDGCLDDAIRSALTRASAATAVHFFWQHTWTRPIPELESACPACKIEEITDVVPHRSPHATIVPDALRRALPELLPAEPAAAR